MIVSSETTHSDTLINVVAPLTAGGAGRITYGLEDFIGRKVAVLGISGTGKTNTAAVLVEEFLSHGLPLTVVDIEGEFYTLREKFDVVLASGDSNTDVPLSFEEAGPLAQWSFTKSVPIILDLSEFTMTEAKGILLQYYNGLWEASKKQHKPYQLIIEEAHEFVPQGRSSELKEVINRVGLRGRKRGIGTVLVSQRSAKVDKDILTQADVMFLHRVIHPTDMKIYKELIPLKPTEVEARVGALQPGQAINIVNHEAIQVQVRLRHTSHAGATPGFNSSKRGFGSKVLWLEDYRRFVKGEGFTETKPQPTTPAKPDLVAQQLEFIETEKLAKTIAPITKKVTHWRLRGQDAWVSVDPIPGAKARRELAFKGKKIRPNFFTDPNIIFTCGCAAKPSGISFNVRDARGGPSDRYCLVHVPYPIELNYSDETINPAPLPTAKTSNQLPEPYPNLIKNTPTFWKVEGQGSWLSWGIIGPKGHRYQVKLERGRYLRPYVHRASDNVSLVCGCQLSIGDVGLTIRDYSNPSQKTSKRYCVNHSPVKVLFKYSQAVG